MSGEKYSKAEIDQAKDRIRQVIARIAQLPNGKQIIDDLIDHSEQVAAAAEAGDHDRARALIADYGAQLEV